MATAINIKKWGNSLGVVLPMDIIKHQHLQEGDTILVEVVKKADLRPVFGTLHRKLSGQQFKNFVREGWK